MAIFASTTVPYSAPSQALTIKALEKRQADLLAQQAQASNAITPENTQTPLQGVGHVLNQVADSMALRRAENQAAAGKAQLAQLIAGYDPAKPDAMKTVGQIGIYNPELAASLMQNFHEDATQRARFAHEDTSQQAGFTQADKTAAAKVEADKAAAADAAAAQTERDRAKAATDVAAAAQLAETQAKEKRTEEAAREAAAVKAEERVQARPTDEDAVKLQRALSRGEITKDVFDARMKKITDPSVQEQEKIIAHQKASVDSQSLLSKMDEAIGLIDDPKGIHTGNYAGVTQSIGEHVPKALQGTGYVPDPVTTENTRRYNMLMGEQVLKAVNEMKGASSDRDVQFNLKIANDPNASAQTKKAAILKVKERLVALQGIEDEAIKKYGEKPPVLPSLSGGTAKPAETAADPLEGRTATGPNGEKMIRRNGKWESQ